MKYLLPLYMKEQLLHEDNVSNGIKYRSSDSCSNLQMGENILHMASSTKDVYVNLIFTAINDKYTDENEQTAEVQQSDGANHLEAK